MRTTRKIFAYLMWVMSAILLCELIYWLQQPDWKKHVPLLALFIFATAINGWRSWDTAIHGAWYD